MDHIEKKKGEEKKGEKNKNGQGKQAESGQTKKVAQDGEKNNEQRSLNVLSVEMTIMPTPVLIARRLQLESNKTLEGGMKALL